MAKMSVQDKVGQCFVIGFTGSVMTPAILERIANIRPAGVRMGMNFRIKSAYYDPYAVGEKFAHRALRSPTGTVKDFLPGLPPPYLTCAEYADFLNRLKRAALANPAGIPLHITYDMEGDISADFPRSPMRFFPSSTSGTTRSRIGFLAKWKMGGRPMQKPAPMPSLKPGKPMRPTSPWQIISWKGSKSSGFRFAGSLIPSRLTCGMAATPMREASSPNSPIFW